jgi:hypothetical protein
LVGGKFRPLTAVKSSTSWTSNNKILHEFPFNDIKAAIATGEVALGEGVNLLENLKKFRPWLAKMRAQTAPAPQK